MIRRYGVEDIPQMLDAVGVFLGKSETYKRTHYKRDKLRYMLEQNVRNNRFFCNVGIEDVEGKEVVIGGLCAQVHEYTFSKEIYAADHIFYITEDRRGLRLATDLVEGYVEWAKKRGARECRLANSTGYKVEAYGKLCERLGFTNLGPIYQMRF